jgi:hypothetical protein
MPDPETLEEYNRLYNERTVYEGHFADATMTVPCPFCCAPSFMRWYILPLKSPDVEKAMSEGAVCSSCGRGMKAIFQRTRSGVSFECVQTRGDDVPSYLPPMRRVD